MSKAKKRNERKSGDVTFESVNRPLAQDPVTNAIAALRNNRTISVAESKDGSVVKYSYDATFVAAMRSFFPSGKQYMFRLVGTVIPYPTDGAGNMLATSSFSPAVASFPEWTQLSVLFDEVNLRRARCTLIGGASGLKNVGFAVGYNPNNVSSTPASTTAVVNLGSSKLISSYSTTPVLHVLDQRIPSGRAWAETTVPAVASPPAGCVGSFDFANGGASGTFSSTYFYGLCELVIVLRNRI